jgi:hypothetical protein
MTTYPTRGQVRAVPRAQNVIDIARLEEHTARDEAQPPMVRPPRRMLLTLTETAEWLGVNRSTLTRMMDPRHKLYRPELEVVTIGARKLMPVAVLANFVHTLMREQGLGQY